MRSRSLLLAGALLLGACDGDGGGNRPTTPVANNPTPFPPTPGPPTPAPAASAVGDWRSEARAWYFRLEQSGSTLHGEVLGFRNVQFPSGDPAIQITGTIDSARNVRFSAPVFGIDFGGRLEADGRRMTGTLFDCGNGCRNYGEVLVKQ